MHKLNPHITRYTLFATAICLLTLTSAPITSAFQQPPSLIAQQATPIPLPGAATMGLFLIGGFGAFYRPKPKHHGRRRR